MSSAGKLKGSCFVVQCKRLNARLEDMAVISSCDAVSNDFRRSCAVPAPATHTHVGPMTVWVGFHLNANDCKKIWLNRSFVIGLKYPILVLIVQKIANELSGRREKWFGERLDYFISNTRLILDQSWDCALGLWAQEEIQIMAGCTEGHCMIMKGLLVSLALCFHTRGNAVRRRTELALHGGSRCHGRCT